MRLEERRVIWNRKKAAHRKAVIKKMIWGLAFLIIIVSAVCLIFGKTVKAEKQGEERMCKYYTSSVIDNDDTLWDLASEYSLGYHDYNEYIEEVAFINHIDDINDIRCGQTIIIPYYTYVTD